MNHIKIFWLAIVFTCVSCSKDESVSSSLSVSNGIKRSNLVGEWRVINYNVDDASMVYTLKDNGRLLINGNFSLPIEDPFGGDYEASSYWHFARLDESLDIIIFKGLKSERLDDLVEVTFSGDTMVWMSLRRDSESGQLVPHTDSKCILERVKSK